MSAFILCHNIWNSDRMHVCIYILYMHDVYVCIYIYIYIYIYIIYIAYTTIARIGYISYSLGLGLYHSIGIDIVNQCPLRGPLFIMSFCFLVISLAVMQL